MLSDKNCRFFYFFNVDFIVLGYRFLDFDLVHAPVGGVAHIGWTNLVATFGPSEVHAPAGGVAHVGWTNIMATIFSSSFFLLSAFFLRHILFSHKDFAYGSRGRQSSKCADRLSGNRNENMAFSGRY